MRAAVCREHVRGFAWVRAGVVHMSMRMRVGMCVCVLCCVCICLCAQVFGHSFSCPDVVVGIWK